MNPLRVLSVASEIYPLVKTGGLADVAGALPFALEEEGVLVRSLVPAYPAVKAALEETETAREWPDLFGGPARILAGRARGLELFALDAPHLFDRPGNPYTRPDGGDWPDNALRFAALGRAGADLARGAIPAYAPDLVHCHDWQSGLVPAYLHYEAGARPRSVFTVHNLGFQGQFPRGILPVLGLPARAWAIDGVEYYGTVGFLKAALQLADRITTVSPNYALEIMGPEAGMGLDGLLRVRADAVSGIVNGIDTGEWNPASDTHIPATYDERRLAARGRNASALRERMGLGAAAAGPLFGIVARLSWQKGLDLLLEALPDLLALGGQLALVGSGERALMDSWATAARANPGRVACTFAYDEPLAHLVQAGSDAILVPSRYEPCGLTQLCALRYGAVPVVARVGGLADTVIDAGTMALAAGVATGIQFSPVDPYALRAALRRAAQLHADRPAWTRLQRNGMKTDVSWRNPARQYAALFRGLVNERAGADR